MSYRLKQWLKKYCEDPPGPDTRCETQKLHEAENLRWRQNGGDQHHRFTYPIQPEDVVIDLGGFEGQWASDLYARYRCKVHIFEPVDSYYQSIVTRFHHNPDITVHHCGLAGEERRQLIGMAKNSTSLFKEGSSQEEIHLKHASVYLDALGISRIRLMKINIEGAEYELLRAILDGGWMPRIDYLQVQFHHFVDQAHEQVATIREELQHTHTLQYSYEWMWDSWKIKTET